LVFAARRFRRPPSPPCGRERTHRGTDWPDNPAAQRRAVKPHPPFNITVREATFSLSRAPSLTVGGGGGGVYVPSSRDAPPPGFSLTEAPCASLRLGGQQTARQQWSAPRIERAPSLQWSSGFSPLAAPCVFWAVRNSSTWAPQNRIRWLTTVLFRRAPGAARRFSFDYWGNSPERPPSARQIDWGLFGRQIQEYGNWDSTQSRPERNARYRLQLCAPSPSSP